MPTKVVSTTVTDLLRRKLYSDLSLPPVTRVGGPKNPDVAKANTLEEIKKYTGRELEVSQKEREGD